MWEFVQFIGQCCLIAIMVTVTFFIILCLGILGKVIIRENR